jgi:hypothetical protein
MAKPVTDAADEEKDESGVIDNAALKGDAGNDDEASLNDALQQNPFKMMLIRLVIKLKNHLAILPLLASILSMIIITFNIPWHVQALLLLTNNKFNAILFFLNVLDSLLIVMAYMRVSSKKSGKAMRISMWALFYVLIGFSLFVDYYYLSDVALEMSLYNSMNRVLDNDTLVIAHSLAYTHTHLVFLYIALALSVLAPLLQPFSKKIRIKVKPRKTKAA